MIGPGTGVAGPGVPTGPASLLSRKPGQCRFVNAFTSIAYTVMPDRCSVPKG
jgi:hypothetical protein